VYVKNNTDQSFIARKIPFYYLNTRLAALPILTLVISLSMIGVVNADSGNTTQITSTGTTDVQNMPPGQTSVSCAQGEIDAARQGLSDIQKKMSELRTQYYNDWQTAQNSGQYNGTWEQYSREKISSSADLSQIKTDYQKYSSILRSCGVSHMQPNYSSTTCNQNDISHARQEIATTMRQGMEIKQKIYQQFQQDQASGQFNGTWTQYAQEKLLNLPDLVQLKLTHDKYASFMKSCFVRPNQSQGFTPQNQTDNRMPPPPPDNPDLSSNLSDNLNPSAIPSDLGLSTNSPNGIPSTQQSPSLLPPISSSTDAQGLISSSHGLPAWVKGIAGWWAEGKISDDDFVNAIKFLVHQGIIKV
jgi:hypothetical protein